MLWAEAQEIRLPAGIVKEEGEWGLIGCNITRNKRLLAEALMPL